MTVTPEEEEIIKYIYIYCLVGGRGKEKGGRRYFHVLGGSTVTDSQVVAKWESQVGEP